MSSGCLLALRRGMRRPGIMPVVWWVEQKYFNLCSLLLDTVVGIAKFVLNAVADAFIFVVGKLRLFFSRVAQYLHSTGKDVGRATEVFGRRGKESLLTLVQQRHLLLGEVYQEQRSLRIKTVTNGIPTNYHVVRYARCRLSWRGYSRLALSEGDF